MLNSMLLQTDLWTILINGFASWVGNYGWAIILFTVCLKLVLSPLDIIQRRSSQKQTRVMSAMQPEMAAIQQKYANDKERLNAEQAKLYKKYNVGLGGMCLSLLGTMVISMIVLFSLYGSLRAYGTSKLYSTYKELDTVCVETLDGKQVSELTEDELSTLNLNIKAKYDDLAKQNSWLWVKNVWKSDTNTSQFVDFNSYASNQGLKDQAKTDAKTRYDVIVKAVEGGQQTQNGYFVLIILCAGVSFVMQLLSAKLMTPKGQKLTTMNKVMFAIIPVTMTILATTSNVVFTLYVITNSIMATLITTIISLILRKNDKGKSDKEILLNKRNVEVVEYSRNYKK